jgi:hypothetical protein
MPETTVRPLSSPGPRRPESLRILDIAAALLGDALNGLCDTLTIMCTSTDVSRPTIAVSPRPRWGVLYGVVFLGLVGLAIGDVASPEIARPTLDGALAGAALVAISLWVRGNRVALDQQDWCACAADTVTVRMVTSRRETSAPRFPAPTEHPPAEEADEAWAVASLR